MTVGYGPGPNALGVGQHHLVVQLRLVERADGDRDVAGGVGRRVGLGGAEERHAARRAGPGRRGRRDVSCGWCFAAVAATPASAPRAASYAARAARSVAGDLVGHELGGHQVAPALRQHREGAASARPTRPGHEDLEPRPLQRVGDGGGDLARLSGGGMPPDDVPAASSVSTTTGMTRVRSTPEPRSSSRTAVIQPWTACLVARTSPRRAARCATAMEATVTTWPLRRARMAGQHQPGPADDAEEVDLHHPAARRPRAPRRTRPTHMTPALLTSASSGRPNAWSPTRQERLVRRLVGHVERGGDAAVAERGRRPAGRRSRRGRRAGRARPVVPAPRRWRRRCRGRLR